MNAITAESLRSAITHAGANVIAAQDQLCALDASAGDGDLGATLATGFVAVNNRLSELDQATDPGKLLTEAGTVLIRTAPSTIGTLLGGAFLRGGQALADDEALAPTDLAAALRAIATAVAARGGAAVGERTVLDALDPAAASAERSAAESASVPELVQAAARAARAGADATADMHPVHGRAAWIGARAVGQPDAGATAWAVFMEGLADGVAVAADVGLGGLAR